AKRKSRRWRRPSVPRPSAWSSRCSSSMPTPVAWVRTKRRSRRRPRPARKPPWPRSAATTRARAAAARSSSTAMASWPEEGRDSGLGTRDSAGAAEAVAEESEPSIHVMAAVIADATGRILLARRTEGRDLAGLWEFPGGKREPGETPEAALARELHEELGIVAEIGPAVISVPCRYPHKRLRLDVRRVDAWQGTPKGLDSQALAWVPPHKLTSYAMPGADRPVVAALLEPARDLVTPAADNGDHGAWLTALERAVDADSIRRIHLRNAPPALVRDAAALCRAGDVEVLLNGDIALAR